MRISETRHGRKAARASMDRMRRKNMGYDVDEEDRLQDMYSDIDDYFDGGYDEEDREWIVKDETTGRFVPSGVSQKGPIGKIKAYHNVNSREARKFKAGQMAAAMMESNMKSRLRRLVNEELKSTEKYDDDPALKGDQDELPDKLQKGIIDKKKNEALKRRLRRIVRETAQDVLDYPDPSSVMATEDTWSGGENLHHNIDHAAVQHGAEPNVKEPETLTITELRARIRNCILSL